MRQLVIICESSHEQDIKRNAKAFCHPALQEFVSVIGVDLELGGPFKEERARLHTLVTNDVNGTSQPPLVCCTREAGAALKVKDLQRYLEFSFEVKQETLARLAKARNGDASSVPMQSRLNECGLSLRSGAVELLQHWSHAKIDRNSVDMWLNQFGKLGKQYKWIGEEILASVSLVPAAELGELFNRIPVLDSTALCINRDPRKTAKSGDVISNLLTKRHNGRVIHTSPAEAIDEHDASNIIVFEDGLWSGTEALGIIESMLGERPAGKLKTPCLKNPDQLQKVELVLAYGVATDYGAALVSRFLQDKGLKSVRVEAANIIKVAPADVLEELRSGSVDFSSWRESGPAIDLLPHVFTSFSSRGIEEAQIQIAKQFCATVGGQLFELYIQEQKALHGWTAWPPEKMRRASLGMHGLGMTHAFGHSVPKASLPLLWRGGRIFLDHHAVDWVPLFKNS